MDCLKDSVEKIQILAEKSLIMYNESIEMFLDQKEVNSEEWSKQDDEIDTLHKELIDKITEQMLCNGDEATRAGVSLILSTRYIERIADHACNICEESIYVATSKREPIN
jgi:phosphate transport system protein